MKEKRNRTNLSAQQRIDRKVETPRRKNVGPEIRELPPIIVGGGGSIVILSDQQLEVGNGNIAYPFAYTYPDHSKNIHHVITRDKKGKDKGKADCSSDGDIIIVFST